MDNENLVSMRKLEIDEKKIKNVKKTNNEHSGSGSYRKEETVMKE